MLTKSLLFWPKSLLTHKRIRYLSQIILIMWYYNFLFCMILVTRREQQSDEVNPNQPTRTLNVLCLVTNKVCALWQIRYAYLDLSLCTKLLMTKRALHSQESRRQTDGLYTLHAKYHMIFVIKTYRRGGAQRAHVHATERAILASIARGHRGESRALSCMDMCPLCTTTTIYALF